MCRHPEGIKPAGEGGPKPVPAVIANALDDALAPLGIVVDRVPISPERLRGDLGRGAFITDRIVSVKSCSEPDPAGLAGSRFPGAPYS